MKRFLATSSDPNTWNLEKPIIFLGEWCKKYSKKKNWEKLNYITADPYGITNQEKEKDLNLSKSIEKELTSIIKNNLNKFHNLKYDERLWQIILGPWLRRYSSLIVNRVNVLQKCILENEISETAFYKINENVLIANNSADSVLYFENEIWNQCLNYQILKIIKNKKINIKLINFKKKILLTKAKEFSFKETIFRIIIFISKFTNFLTLFNKIAIVNVYINLRQQILLFLRLLNFPYMRFQFKIDFNSKINNNLRNSLTNYTINLKDDPSINEIAIYLLFKILPICYLEGFKELIKIKNNSIFPIKPKFIVTSVNLDTDEVFKLWVVDKIRNGSKLIVYQHGNNYGTSKYNYPSLDEIVSDKFITWGWKINDEKYLSSQITNRYGLSKIQNYFKNSQNVLLVQNTINPSYHTEDVYYEFSNYFKNQMVFIDKLNLKIRNNLIIRLHRATSLLNHYEENLKWKDSKFNLQIDEGKLKFKKLLKKSKIIIFSYDSTGFLECLAYNIPSLAFWQNDLSHMRESVKSDFEKLVKAEILFFSSKKIADKVNNIYEDVESWWNSDQIQNVRKDFCLKYANTHNPHPNIIIKNLLK